MVDIALFFGGILAGIINAVAGGGSTITLPLLLLVGVDASVANGTNRVAVLFQSVSATYSFSKHGAVNLRKTFRLLPLVLIGAACGAFTAADLNPKRLEIIFGLVFVGLGSFLIFREQIKQKVVGQTLYRVRWLVLLIVGFYGGFLQAGVGIPLLLALLSLYGFNFTEGNGTKVVHIAVYSFLVLFIYGSADQVDTRYGFELGIGGILGSHFGAKLALKNEPKHLNTCLAAFLLFMGIRSLV